MLDLKVFFHFLRGRCKVCDALEGLRLAEGTLVASQCVIITMYFRIWFCVLVWSAWAPNWFNEQTLGTGHHAETQLKHATAKCFQRLKQLIASKVLVKGQRYKTRFPQYYKLRACVAFLMGVSVMTVRRSMEFLKNNNQNAALPKTKPSGRKKMTKAEYQQKYGTVYNAIFQFLRDCKKEGITAKIDDLVAFLRTEEPGRGARQMSYDAVRYYMIKMGFRHGRLTRRIASRRYLAYVINWLVAYCKRRTEYARNPTPEQKKEVHFMCDESFVYRNDSGWYGFFIPGDNLFWGKAKGSAQRWGIFHGLFTWWEQDDVEEEPVYGPPLPPRKRRKKDSDPDPQVPGYTRRFEIFNQTLHCWNCANQNNMNNAKFLQCLDKVCQYVQNNFAEDRILVIHLDNASYHKSANPDYLDLSNAALTRQEIADWIMRNAPEEYGFDDISVLQNEDGTLFSMRDLKFIVNNYCPNHPSKILELIKSYNENWRVEFTPPYWPHTQPSELLWNNFKTDYRGWDPKDKTPRVNESVKTFMNAVTSRDVEGFIRHTDEFCFKINDQDQEFLKSYDLEL